MDRIYLDHAATTPLDPRVLEAMHPCLTAAWGNPSSIYAEAREARRMLDASRRTVADLLGASPAEIVFTSGGSESNNLALYGLAMAGGRGRGIITAATEHHAVLHPAQRLERDGFAVAYLPVDREGFVSVEDVERHVDRASALVSIMLANNETGTVQPVADLVREAKAKNPACVFHTDAVQAPGWIDINVNRLGVDALSLSAHKFGGPRGIGILYLRRGTPIEAQILGGSQERERRAGTENVAGAVGLAKALEIATAEMPERVRRIRPLQQRLLQELPRRIPETVITGPLDAGRRLINNASCCIEGAPAELLLPQLDLAGISASSGSACTSGSLEPSHVLTAMGISAELALASLRLTLGHENTEAEIAVLLDRLPALAEVIRRSQGFRQPLNAAHL